MSTAVAFEWQDSESEEEAPVRRVRPTVVLGEVPEGVWKAGELGSQVTETVPTGWPALDSQLPGGGWPCRSITEVLMAQPAVIEWRLLGAAMRHVVANGGQLVLVGPPKHPHPPGLIHDGADPRQLIWVQAETPAERLWVTEQIVKSDAAGLIVAWLEGGWWHRVHDDKGQQQSQTVIRDYWVALSEHAFSKTVKKEGFVVHFECQQSSNSTSFAAPAECNTLFNNMPT